MISHDSDILLSVISSTTAAVLLFSLQWTSTACLLVLCSLYFLTKLWKTDQVDSPKDFQVIIVGAGVAGIAMGKKLNDLGIRYVILEKSDSLGGTWYENTYPGCACDITSHLYSFSFYQNPRWSRAFSRQPEILSYLQDVACKFGVFPHIKFGKTIKRNIWNQETHQWTLETSEGETITANVVISGVGFLHVAKYPNIPVMKQFKGQAFHTSSWPKDYSPRNKRIAVIGTGASAVQTVPNVAAMEPANLTVFQRTPCWSPLRHDHLYPEWVKIVFTYVPFTNTMFRWFHFWVNELFYRIIFTTDSWITVKASALAHYIVKKHITDIVKDQKLAARLTPSYNMGCKRITPSDSYLATFNKDFVHLNTSGIECLTSSGIKTQDGIEHEFDTIVYATGFDLEKSHKPFEQIGLEGSLGDNYGDAPHAYLGISHHNHPNYFILHGPGTGLGHNSVIYMIECQVNYVADGIVKMIKAGTRSVVLKEEVMTKYQAFVKKNMKGKVFANDQCQGWYLNSNGVNWTLWPLDLVSYWWYTRSFQMEDYNIAF